MGNNNMRNNLSIQRIINKVVSLPLNLWQKSNSEIYEKDGSEAFEMRYRGATLTVILSKDCVTSLWYDGVFVTDDDKDIAALFMGINEYQKKIENDEWVKRIEEIANLF